MGKKGPDVEAPDYGPVIASAEKQFDMAFKLQQEQLAWAKEQYAKDSEITGKTVDAFLDSMNFNLENAKKDRARYEEEYQPVEDRLLEDAKTYDSPERRSQEMGRAQAEVGQQFDAARENAQRDLEAYGINPSATRYGALDIGVRTAEAAAKAAASDNASRQVENTARALRSEAINVGRGYPAQVNASSGVGTQAGNSAVGNQLATTGSGGATMGTAPAWAGAAGSALGSWGGFLNSQFNNQLDAAKYQQSQSSGLGQILGIAAGTGLKLAGFDDGGRVPERISPSRGAIPDDIPIAVSAGEYIVPEDTVRWFGEEHFHKLTEKAQEGREKRRALPTG